MLAFFFFVIFLTSLNITVGMVGENKKIFKFKKKKKKFENDNPHHHSDFTSNYFFRHNSHVVKRDVS